MKQLILALVLILFSAPAFAQDHSGHGEMTLRQVTAEHVCMVNDTAFDAPQILTEVDGKKYYGCCSMCKARLEKDASIRKAIDPVSKVEVDKSTAVIGATADNKVMYFENEENFHTFMGHVSHDHKNTEK